MYLSHTASHKIPKRAHLIVDFVCCDFAIVINGCDSAFFMRFLSIHIRWTGERWRLNAKKAARYIISRVIAWIKTVVYVWIVLKEKKAE